MAGIYLVAKRRVYSASLERTVPARMQDCRTTHAPIIPDRAKRGRNSYENEGKGVVPTPNKGELERLTSPFL